MPYNNYNYLLEVRAVQREAKKILDEYVFITFAQVHRIMREKEQFFKGYRAFLKYMAEVRVNERISEYEIKTGKSHLNSPPCKQLEMEIPD